MRIYNTLSRTVEEFVPLSGGKKVTMYCCGPTVYDYTHLGHLWKYTMDDTIRRTLTFLGYDVLQVMNITDVGHLVSDADEGEDKLEKGARKSGKTVWEVAELYTDFFNRSMRAMGILEPNVTCKATEHITEMIELVRTLETKGFTYTTSGAVYFDTSKFPNYGSLTGQKLEEKKRAVRAEVVDDAEKKNPYDFALWFKRVGRFADHTMHWESPWGDGFPGWHIECSAMSMKYLGPQIDIHTGGIDHISVHHPNEIAQSEAATDKSPFVKYWVHHNFVQVEGEKMSKSLENFLTIDDVTKRGIDPYALRLLFLQAHYRNELNFTWDALKGSEVALKRLREIYCELGNESNTRDMEIGGFMKQFIEAIADDVNTAKAVSILWQMIKSDLTNPQKKALIDRWNTVLGLDLAPRGETDIPQEVVSLAEKRKDAKEKKDFSLADDLRKKIEEKGYIVKDQKNDDYVIHRR
jgi:cysteinyl-tRNA synthetase